MMVADSTTKIIMKTFFGVFLFSLTTDAAVGTTVKSNMWDDIFTWGCSYISASFDYGNNDSQTNYSFQE